MATIGLKTIRYADESNRVTDLVNKNFQTLEIALKGKLNGSNINEMYLKNFIADHVQAGDVLITTGGTARVVLNENIIAMQVMEGGIWVNKVYFDTVSGQYIFDGTLSANVVEALSAVIAPNLYAEKATIAELTVDQLDTSDKVIKYISGDITPDNYQKIYDQFHEFVTATTDGLGTEQVTNRYGEPLYWISAAREAASTEITPWPVYSYKYQNTTKLQIGFEGVGGDQIPIITLGAGDGVLDKSAKGEIFKSPSGLEINYYRSNTGALRQIKLADNGIFINGLIYELTALNISSNSFQATYGSVIYDAHFTKDTGGRITSISCGGNTIPITYNEV